MAKLDKSNPCQQCNAKCCRYVALPIETPETKSDFDDIRWYVAHKNVSVFIEDGEWYICFNTQCDYLGKDLLCAIYEDRPKICRGYSTENCELTGEPDKKDLRFKTIEDIEEYAKEFLNKKRKKKADKKKTKKDKKKDKKK